MGMVYVAFVIDVLARRIVGWRVLTSMTTGFVPDALNQAVCQQCPAEGSGLIHHVDPSPGPRQPVSRNPLYRMSGGGRD